MSAKTILIVDDEDDLRESLREALEDAGYTVSCAKNGREALESMREATPSVVLLDLIMPVMSGTEVMAAMQTEPRLATVPVVISTSDPSRAPSGALIMKKPIDLGRLISTIAKLS